MKKILIATALLGASVCLPAMAQQTSGSSSGNGLQMPYQRNFWGYAGVAGGVSDYDNCPGGGCDNRDSAWKIYGGGNFNKIFGGEISYIDLGKQKFTGGDARAEGLNFSLTAGVPLGANSNVFAKLGTMYARTNVSGLASSGRDDDWGLSYGVGGSIGITNNLQVRLDWDRYHLSYVGSRDDHTDALTVGLQMKF